MEIKELYRQVNNKSVERHERPITDVEFIEAIASLILKGLIVQEGNEVFINNAT